MKQYWMRSSTLLLVSFSLANDALAELQGGSDFGGPNAVGNTLREDGYAQQMDRWENFKKGIDEKAAIHFALEYNSLVQGYTESGLDDSLTAGGIARFYGTWSPVNTGEKNEGFFVFRADNRHSYTDVSPQNQGFGAGTSSINGTLFSDRGWGIVNLQWSQFIMDGRAGFIVGFSPADDYFHAYGLASPTMHFSNLSFSTGAVVAIPDTGLAIAGAAMLSDHWYVKAGVHDANGDATDLNFDVFQDWELYKNLEIGWTSAQSKLYLDNTHLGVWHSDRREDDGVPESWGVTFNWSRYDEASRLMPYIRGGWSDGGAALMEKMVSAGVGKAFREKDLLGIGVSWGDPSDSEQGAQWSNEIFYRWQYENLALTPSMQILINPSNNPDKDVILVGGLRARIVF